MEFVVTFLVAFPVVVSIVYIVGSSKTHKELKEKEKNNLCDTCEHCITICGSNSYWKYHTDYSCPLGYHDTMVVKCQRYEEKETSPSTK